MAVEPDHVFICVTRGAPEARRWTDQRTHWHDLRAVGIVQPWAARRIVFNGPPRATRTRRCALPVGTANRVAGYVPFPRSGRVLRWEWLQPWLARRSRRTCDQRGRGSRGWGPRDVVGVRSD